METKKIVNAFVVGSSIVSTIISFLYIGNAFRNSNRPSDVQYETFPVFIPIMFGIANIMNVLLVQKYPKTESAIFSGAALGLLFSIIGRFGLDLPVKIFDTKPENEFKVHIYAFGTLCIDILVHNYSLE